MTPSGDQGDNPFHAPERSERSLVDEAGETSSAGIAWTIRGMGIALILTGLGFLGINLTDQRSLFGYLIALAYIGAGAALALLHQVGRVAATAAALGSSIVGFLFIMVNGIGLLMLIPVGLALYLLWNRNASRVFRLPAAAEPVGAIFGYVVAGLILGAAFAFPGACTAAFLTAIRFRMH